MNVQIQGVCRAGTMGSVATCEARKARRKSRPSNDLGSARKPQDNADILSSGVEEGLESRSVVLMLLCIVS